MQLATVFAEEIAGGMTVTAMITNLGKAEFDNKLRMRWNRFVGKSKGPWQVGKGLFNSFDSAYRYQSLKVVLGQNISNIKKQKGAKRGPDVAATGATTAAAAATTAAAGTAAATTAAPVAGAAAEQAAEPEDRAPEAQRQPL
ncbi:hypothetical protein HYH02_006698 [Chlamydomonas schloesseri]|uniref:Uncharacterized protein n=1 Tax=Chlamydomonas schloesseri TaxID=2026947 RepID=A0A835WIR1_9CHLO|nr:hypothetical protein HYH02_006698 [Chlamydomonas schloesseri]|eukprot:KAG2448112.1 hypothetical protein HYH02_006698 [Chlamydomonas schloesseri]